MLRQDRLNNSLFSDGAIYATGMITIWFKVIYMKPQYVFVVNSMGYGICMQLLLKYILCRNKRLLCTIYLCISCIVGKNRCSCKSEKLGIREKFLDGLVIFSKLRAMTFVKNEYNPFFAQ